MRPALYKSPLPVLQTHITRCLQQAIPQGPEMAAPKAWPLVIQSHVSTRTWSSVGQRQMRKVPLVGGLPPAPGSSPETTQPRAPAGISRCVAQRRVPDEPCPSSNPERNAWNLLDQLRAWRRVGASGSQELRLQSCCSSRSSSPKWFKKISPTAQARSGPPSMTHVAKPSCQSPTDGHLTPSTPFGWEKGKFQPSPCNVSLTAGLTTLWGSEQRRAPTTWSPLSPCRKHQRRQSCPRAQHNPGNPQT